ncbi:MAG: hypothetical protein JW795_15940 [Chitinivibrionales bacterium]|nr:hypothetical protein [Chitinivibrionales bacterium]
MGTCVNFDGIPDVIDGDVIDGDVIDGDATAATCGCPGGREASAMPEGPGS